ncbi:MAG: N-6 DNA methylase [Aureliella sp.]
MIRRHTDFQANFGDQPGYCKSATLDEICKHDFVLTPGRYVGEAGRPLDLAARIARLLVLSHTAVNGGESVRSRKELLCQTKS